MRIAYLINQYPKVSHSFIRREILALERQGISIVRIALRGWDDQVADSADLSERDNTRYVLRDGPRPLFFALIRTLAASPIRLFAALSLCWRMSRRAERPLPVHAIYLAEACRILQWLREERVEHVHAHFGTNSAEVAMLVQVLGGPGWSFTVHGPEEFDKPLSIGLAEKIRRAKFVVAVSSFGRSQLYRLVEYELWPKIHIVHCGLDTAFITVESAPSTAQRLVCVGRLCEQKGQLLLIEATYRLLVVGVDLELVLAGDGELRSDIEALIMRYKLQGKVRITGWIGSDQVRDEILAARALVLPSFAEGLPVVLMEAMALQRPVISTYVAGIPELVVPGDHGWLVPAGEIDALVRAMHECLMAPLDVLQRMGGAARERALVLHDSNKETKKLAALFKTFASGRVV